MECRCLSNREDVKGRLSRSAPFFASWKSHSRRRNVRDDGRQLRWSGRPHRGERSVGYPTSDSKMTQHRIFLCWVPNVCYPMLGSIKEPHGTRWGHRSFYWILVLGIFLDPPEYAWHSNNSAALIGVVEVDVSDHPSLLG